MFSGKDFTPAQVTEVQTGSPAHSVKIKSGDLILSINDKKVGRLSRAFFSPRLKKNIGLAIVDIDFALEGTELSVESPNGDLLSKVVSLPWYTADKETHLD